jgi:tetratricopeptide (TPR) repeat protein
LTKEKRPRSVLLLAWQVWQLGDQALSDELFDSTLAGASGKERQALTLLAIEYLWQTQQYTRADSLLQPLLKDEKLAQHPRLWRLGAALAVKEGKLARQLACLEKAMDLEYRHLPEMINLQTVRSDYAGLLQRYEQLVVVASMLDAPQPKDLLVKVVRAADRWRSLESDGSAACQAAAQVLKKLGAHELAWEYLTSGIGQRPDESGPWLGIAQIFRQENDLPKADWAYTRAFEVEPTNPQILWERAMVLGQAGKTAQALQIYQQIADGTWQPRFQGIQQQARMFLNNR